MAGKGATKAAGIERDEVALMLCEVILHVLVDRGLLAKDDVIEALDGVLDILTEMDEPSPIRRRGGRGTEPRKLIEAIRATFQLK